MWKCPQCETVNKDDKCVICGEANPYFPKVPLNGTNNAQGTSKLRSTMRTKSTSYGSAVSAVNRKPITAEVDALLNAESAQNGTKANEDAIYATTRIPSLPHHNGNAESPTPQTVKSGVAVAEKPKGDLKDEASVPNLLKDIPENSYNADSDIGNILTDGEPKKSKKWIVVLVLILVLCGGGFFGYMELQKSWADTAFEKGDYDKAKAIYSDIGFYRGASDKINECDYEKAERLFNAGNEADAADIFRQLGHYKDSDLRLKACDYAIAEKAYEEEDFLEAYERLIKLESVNYEDSEEKLEDVVHSLYEKGIELYRIGEYQESHRCFTKYGEGCRNLGLTVDFEYASYIKLNEAWLEKVEDISELYELLDFENTKELLISDKYIRSFLMGKWLANDNNSIEFVEENGGVKIICTLPFEEGSHYKISDGVQYHGNDDDGWIEGLKYEIVHEDKIEVYCYMNEKTYVMYRQ